MVWLKENESIIKLMVFQNSKVTYDPTTLLTICFQCQTLKVFFAKILPFALGFGFSADCPALAVAAAVFGLVEVVLGLGLVLDFLAAGGPEGDGVVWTTSTTLISDLSDLVEDPVSRLFRLPPGVVAALDEEEAWSNMISSFCKRGRSRESPPPPPLVTTGWAA